MMITAIISSMFESPSTSDDNDMENGASKSTLFEPTIKHSMKKTRLDHRSARN